MDPEGPRWKNVSKKIIDKEMMKFTLSLYNNPLLSRKAVDEVIETFDNFFSDILIPFIQDQMENELKPKTDEDSYYKVRFILERNKRIFCKFSTEHLRIKMYEEESVYIPPEIFEIGVEPVHVIKDNETVVVENKKAYGVHVPLKKTLETFFTIPGIFQGMEQYAQKLYADKDFLSNFIQGDLWLRKYCPKNEGKMVFPFTIFFDDFEVGNTLGSHAGEQKFGGMYGSIPCLPPHLVAKFQNIFLLTICHSKHMKKFGNEKIFEKSIHDLNILSEEGLVVTVDGVSKKVYFECVLILGDNLGLNTTCGFSESFMATRYCRICSATSEQCGQMLVEDERLVRTVESYENDLLKNDSAATGIKERCVFNKINNFHIAENVCLDEPHDFGEGVLPYSIGAILEKLIDAKIVSLDIINHRIGTFPLPESEKSNKPRPLYFTQSKKGGKKLKLKQSASEMLCLARYLGLMIGDLIPANNEYWKLYRCLRKILGVITSPKLSRGEIHNLKELIQKHNFMYTTLFGPLKPKMHFALHYIRAMLLNGPIIHFSSLMFERKNKKLKEIALGTTCNINLPYTIAVRHQLQQCYMKESTSSQNVIQEVSLGPVKKNNALLDIKKLIPNISEQSVVTTLKFVEILGKKFSAGTIIVTRMTEENPQFGIIKEIFHYNGVYIQVDEFETLHFDDYYHSHVVNSNCDKPELLINIELIPKLPPCLYLKKNKQEYVATRYDI